MASLPSPTERNRAPSGARTLVMALGSMWFAAPAYSLEKTAEPLGDDHDRSWRSGSVETYVYYNTCNGWTLTWTPETVDVHQFGVVFEPALPPDTEEPRLVVSWHRFPLDLSSGYGFTGSIDVHHVDAVDCPTGPPLAVRPILPKWGWNEVWWDMAPIPSRFVLVYKTGGTFHRPLEGVNTDHPAAGPTGPPACGNCYPESRTIRSYYYGTTDSLLCPGSPFNDGVCDAELLWEAVVETTSSTSLEGLSWGRLKALYR